ncbi:MAG: MinD/ParA family protein [Spirochaetaceae bacterium]|jgi:flagellar biosynthesis protein FlhG|nr:MinD/ParA family protein [Spirochaetaceae bacterium]
MEDQMTELRAIMTDQGILQKKKNGDAKKALVIAVTSGKGGVGKTNIAINMAIAYAQMGKKTVLIDGDLGMANINVILNIVPKYNLLHVINKQRKMSEIVEDTEFGFRFVAGANGFSSIANMTQIELELFAEEFCTIGNADIIIIDTGAGIAKNVLQFIAAADEVFVVTTPEPTAITDAYGIIKIIATEMFDKDIHLKLLVNRVHSADEAKRISDRIINIVAQFLSFRIDYLGFIYEDPAVAQSVIRQKPFLIADPQSKSSLCVRHITGRLERIGIAAHAQGMQGFLRKFLKKS